MAERGLVSSASSGSSSFAKRGAIALMVIALSEALIGFIVPAANVIVLLATGATPNHSDDPGASVIEKWRGLVPFPVPWWVYAIVAVALGVLLVLTRDRSRQYTARMTGKVLLRNTPYFLAFWAFLWALLSIGLTMYYTTSGVGLYWIPAVMALAVAVAAVWIGLRQRAVPTKKKRRARAA